MSNRKEFIVRRVKGAIVFHAGTPRELRYDGWEVVNAQTKCRVGEIVDTSKYARKIADDLTQNHEPPFVFEDSKISAMLRMILRAQDWVPQAECSRYFGVMRYGRSDLYHIQAGNKRWIVYRDVRTGRLGKSRPLWDAVANAQVMIPPQEIVHREWRWNLGTIEDYFKLLTDDQLAAAFVFCEDGIMGQIRDKHKNGEWFIKPGTYREGGRVFTSQEQWGKWLQYINNEINRRSYR